MIRRSFLKDCVRNKTEIPKGPKERIELAELRGISIPDQYLLACEVGFLGEPAGKPQSR